MSKVPLEEQSAIVAKMMSMLNGRLTQLEREKAQATVKTLDWLAANPEKVHMASLLYKDERVQAVLQALPPGTRMDAIRRFNIASEEEDYNAD